MRKLVVDYGQASITINNVNSSLEYLNEELRQIKNAISEIEALNVRYSKTNTILDELYEQKKKQKMLTMKWKSLVVILVNSLIM